VNNNKTNIFTEMLYTDTRFQQKFGIKKTPCQMAGWSIGIIYLAGVMTIKRCGSAPSENVFTLLFSDKAE